MCDEDSRGYVNKKSFKVYTVKGVTRTLKCIVCLKVHKIEIFGFDFEISTFSLLVMLQY